MVRLETPCSILFLSPSPSEVSNPTFQQIYRGLFDQIQELRYPLPEYVRATSRLKWIVLHE